MPEMTAYEPGTPSWVDLGAKDVNAAAAFYKAVMGWDVRDLGPDAGGYGMFVLNGKQVAGVGPLQHEAQPPAWSTYVSVDDADAAAARIEAAGGSIMLPPMDVMEEGRVAFAADPAGAPFGLWQPRNMKGAEVVNEPGSLCWNELMSRDPSASAAFYEQVFGCKGDTADFEGTTYTQFKLNDRSIAGMMPMPDSMPAEVPSSWLAYFAVADCDAAVAAATGGGGAVVTPAIDMSIGRFAVLSDPGGAVFAVLQMAAEEE
jgi:predicted enzyme related to lactoylglutathione lyase